MRKSQFRGTTILGVRSKRKVAMGGDGQVTFGETVIKRGASKVRKLYNDTVLAGFAGTAADSLTLRERFEAKLEEFSGNLQRAAVEFVREWRTDKYMRRLEAMLVVMDRTHAYILSGEGDLIEPDDGIVAVGSGGPYALAAARAYLDASELDARTIVDRSLKVAASICVYTNDSIVIEEL